MKQLFLVAVLGVLFLLTAFVFLRNYFYKKSLYYRLGGVKRRQLKKSKGHLGEQSIVKTLSTLKKPWHILLNLYLPLHGGKKTECDIVFIHPNGVLVIESKNYRGNIVGDDEDKFWAQEFGDKGYSFYNPVNQNKVHINAIIKNIIIKRENLYSSLIVFGEEANLNFCSTQEENTFLLTQITLKKFLKKFQKQQPLLNEYEIDEIYLRLKPYTNADFFTRNDHKKDLQYQYNTGGYHDD